MSHNDLMKLIGLENFIDENINNEEIKEEELKIISSPEEFIILLDKNNNASNKIEKKG